MNSLNGAGKFKADRLRMATGHAGCERAGNTIFHNRKRDCLTRGAGEHALEIRHRVNEQDIGIPLTLNTQKDCNPAEGCARDLHLEYASGVDPGLEHSYEVSSSDDFSRLISQWLFKKRFLGSLSFARPFTPNWFRNSENHLLPSLPSEWICPVDKFALIVFFSQF